jgi:cytochrome c-type biogenesis protein CcmE
MKPHRRRRLYLVLFVVAASASAAALALRALNENINLFYSPAQIVAGQAPRDTLIRAGGMVVRGSLERDTASLKVRFGVSDLAGSTVPVEYEGMLPDLFREGQGVVALGRLDGRGVFVAEEVLAKHDENYMPPEVKGTLAEAGARAP